MALNLTRWLIAVLAGCALVAVAYLPQDRLERDRVLVRVREWKLRSLLISAQYELERLTLRDSLIVKVEDADRGSPDRPLLVVEEGVPPHVREAVSRLLEKPLASPALADSGRLFVAVVWRRGPSELRLLPYGLGDLTHFLPRATDGRTCLSVLAARWSPAGEQIGFQYFRWVADTAAAILGPCVYYAAFGQPGSSIEKWLQATDHVAARLPVWATTNRPPAPYSGYWLSSMRRLSPHLLACAAGRKSMCRRGLLGEVRRDVYERPRPGHISFHKIRQARPLGDNHYRYLSDLLTEMGEERFASFWTSELSADSAFTSAFGLPLEDWTMKWARSQVGKPQVGPRVSLEAALWAPLTSVLLVAATMVYMSRKRER